MREDEFDQRGEAAAIRELRKRLGLTQAKLAALVGVHRSTVSRWERGRHTPSPARALSLAKIEQPPRLSLIPLSLQQAFAYIKQHHRHHRPPQGAKFAVGVAAGEQLVGVATVGRPVARGLDDGWTLEVTRVATDGTRNAPSMLYGAAWRAARAIGYRRLVTYTLPSESGTSLRGAGWRLLGQTTGGSWSCASRPRQDHHPLGPKLRWILEEAAGIKRSPIGSPMISRQNLAGANRALAQSRQELAGASP
jgi:transcriptional regulator with XRE-family HTH domain